MTIMNNAVSYSLRFAEYMLHMSLGSFFFFKRAVLLPQIYHICYHFQALFCFLMAS